MKGGPGSEAALPLAEELLRRPEDFSYFQALRVIRQALSGGAGGMGSLIRRGIRIRADAALGFPGSDLVQAERLPGPVAPAPRPPAAGPGDGLPQEAGLQGASGPAGVPGPAGAAEAPGAAGLQGDPGAAGVQGAAGTAEAADLKETPDGWPRQEEAFDFTHPLYRLTVTFMGLYGAASPLPHFYAQEILQDEINDEHAARELLDLISFSGYRAHALSYFYSLLPFRVLELRDPAARGALFALMGEPPRREVGAGDFTDFSLFATKVRSADGLLSLLRAAAPEAGLELIENVPRWVTIPEAQRGSLRGSASRLGSDAVLGSRAKDLAGKFRLRAAAGNLGELESLMPGGQASRAMAKAVARYLESPLVWDLEIRLPPGAAEGIVLGARKGRLGLSAFLAPDKARGGQRVFNRNPEAPGHA
ncbi:MAG: type VI secretion system baseplate subunit TssG [Deltaproteobacteria bacterium]|jgi:type VI secretion system protein ImpH|nr:type VI secretion system baseplate subunit TssG [Deltaproteobacteria bacterium]